jgi:hypothetical protein
MRSVTAFAPLFLLTALDGASGWVVTAPRAQFSNAAASTTPGYYNSGGTLWRNPNSFSLDTLAVRWGATPFTHTYGAGTSCTGTVTEPSSYTPLTSGLNGGITFAFHKEFCTNLLHLFPEENPTGEGKETTFLTCEELRDVVARAFNTWAINHRSISFKDVTDKCVDVTTTSGCEHAEIFIVSGASNNGATSTTGDQAALAITSFRPGRVWTTAGQKIDNSFEITGAIMYVRAPESTKEFCWYLDSTFCLYFHLWNDRGTDVILIARIIAGVVFILAVMAILWCLVMTASAAFCLPKVDLGVVGQEGEDELSVKSPGRMPPSAPPSPPPSPPEPAKSRMSKFNASKSFNDVLSGLGTAEGVNKYGDEEGLTCGSKRLTNVIEYVAVMPTITLLIAIFWIICAPMFYYRIFIPCWDCHGFEAAIAHEVGHVLGFHHPDQEWRHNLKAKYPMNQTSCTTPLNHVLLSNTATAATAPEHLPTESIMFSQSLFRYRTCLSADDLEGLNFLYPTCSGAFEPLDTADGPQPLCIKGRNSSGWLRLIFIVTVPFLISSTFVVLVQMCVRREQRTRRKSLEATAMRLRAQRSLLVDQLKKRTMAAATRAPDGTTPRGGRMQSMMKLMGTSKNLTSTAEQAAVYVLRAGGDEKMGFVQAYDPKTSVYTIKLDGSGIIMQAPGAKLRPAGPQLGQTVLVSRSNGDEKKAVIDAFDPATNKYTVTFAGSGLSVVIAADKVRSMRVSMAKRQASRANVLDAELAAQREQAKAMEAAQKAKQQLVAALKAAELAAILAVAEEEDRKIEREATKDRRAKVSFGAGNMGVSGYRSANKEPTPACAKPKVRPKTERKANPRDELEAAMTDLAVNA